MQSGGLYRKLGLLPGSGEVYLRVRSIQGNTALCDEMIMAEHEEDDRVYHNLEIPLRLLETGYRSLDEHNPVVDLLYPLLT